MAPRESRSVEIMSSNSNGSNGMHRRQHENHDDDDATSDQALLKKMPLTNNPRTNPNSRLPHRRRSRSSPPTTGKRRRLIEDHFRVDPVEKNRLVVLPGVPKHEDDWPRDVHDYFNLVVLIPVVVLNVMNWNWGMLWNLFSIDSTQDQYGIRDCWTGNHFESFFACTMMYFLVDLMWVLTIPACVKSPTTIIQHHIATILYLAVPWFSPACRWGMGACMCVEINTWFLIARRVFNKQGLPPWTLDIPYIISIRIKLISVFFYLTWLGIRCTLYPYLVYEFVVFWLEMAAAKGTKWNEALFAVALQCCFCVLNYKWTYDLVNSKIRYWKRLKAGKVTGPDKVDKGL